MHNLTPEEQFTRIVKQAGINFLATLPCDRIKNLLAHIRNSYTPFELTREEDGLGICAGAWLAGAKPLMLIQSTGLGNMINALFSLNTASAVPIPVIASWRGFYNEGIDSQIPMGRQLPALLSGCGIRHTRIEEPDHLPRIADVIADAFDNNRPHIALVSPKVWEGSACTAWQDTPPLPMRPRPAAALPDLSPIPVPEMTRHGAIAALAELLDTQAVVANLGIPSKELFAVRDRALNYYMLGSMGLVSSIGLGIACNTDRQVMVLDGDGSLTMNPNALLNIGRYRPANLMVIALDNAVYGSTGSQNSATLEYLDLECIAGSCGIRRTARVGSRDELKEVVREFEGGKETSFIHVVLNPGNAACATIPLTPVEITHRFRESLNT